MTPTRKTLTTEYTLTKDDLVAALSLHLAVPASRLEGGFPRFRFSYGPPPPPAIANIYGPHVVGGWPEKLTLEIQEPA